MIKSYNLVNVACSLFRTSVNNANPTIGNDAGWKSEFPWLFYSTAPEAIMKSQQLKMQVSFKLDSTSKKNKMEFYVSEYTLNGTYLGFFPVQNQLSLCSRTGQDISDFKRFGVTFQTR